MQPVVVQELFGQNGNIFIFQAIEQLMEFTFDWKEEVSGKVEIEASSGRQAEAIFNAMNRQDLLKQSAELKSQGVEIDFIDSRLSGMVTHKEWEEDWRMSDEEWEQYENMVPEWA